MTLAEALQNVPLETGRTYRCRVREHMVELRVLEPPPDLTAFAEPEVMLDPWLELPAPEGGTVVLTHPGKADPPDAPEIPAEEE